MKLFVLCIVLIFMDWILSGDAKIRIAIRDHIFLFLSCSSPILENPQYKP